MSMKKIKMLIKYFVFGSPKKGLSINPGWRTYQPDDRPGFNEWCRLLRVSTIHNPTRS